MGGGSAGGKERTLGCLPPLRLAHDVELGPEQAVEERTCVESLVRICRLREKAKASVLFPVDCDPKTATTS